VIRQSALRGEVVVILESGKEATFKAKEIIREKAPIVSAEK
jgi:hypothetical protein